MKKMSINHSNLNKLAKELRSRSTVSESLLWAHLKSQKMYGYTFHRQKTIGGYIVDFFAPELQLIIEIDNKSYFTNQCPQYDRRRQLELEILGFHVLKFQDSHIKKDIKSILMEIEIYIQEFQNKPISFQEDQTDYFRLAV